MKTNFFLLTLILLVFGSCRKSPGPGGNSAITGKVIVNHYNPDFSLLKSTEPAIDEYVYIIYNEGSGYGTRVKTAYDGTFEFTNLTKGDYQIYVYSMDTTRTSSNGYIPVIKNISVTKKKQVVDAGTIKIADNKVVGFAKIRGKVKEINTQNNTQYYVAEQRVYIVYDNEINYRTSIKTNFNGEYEFSDLPTGTYTIYAYSVDVNNQYPSNQYEVKQVINITSPNQVYEAPDIVIYK